MSCLRIFAHLCIGLALSAGLARAEGGMCYVDNEKGDDTSNGLAEVSNEHGVGPVKTFAKAVSLLSPGATLNIVPTSTPYHETLQLNDVAGTSDKPIIIDGHGATITGCDLLRSDWVEAGSPGLYKSDKLLGQLEEANEQTKLQRMFFVFDGVVQRMNRTSKGYHAPFKKPETLQPGEWTFDEATKTFFVRVAGTLAEGKVEAPYRRNGLAIRGRKGVSDLIIRNLVCVHVLNDGFNLHGTNVKAVAFQNIASYENGDDGWSPHESVESSIDGYWASGNSTGIAIGGSNKTKMANMRLEANFADEFLTGLGGGSPRDEIRDSVLLSTTGGVPFLLGKNQKGAVSLLENVIVATTGAKPLEVAALGSFDGNRLTVVGVDWKVGGAVTVKQSVVGGKKVACTAGASWIGEKNTYDIGLDETATKGSADCTKTSIPSGLPSLKEALVAGVGADPTTFAMPPRPVPNPAAGKFLTLPPLAEPK